MAQFAADRMAVLLLVRCAAEGRPIYAHSGVLGMGLLPAFRGQGIEQFLLQRTLEAARANGLTRVELNGARGQSGRDRSIKAWGLRRRAFSATPSGSTDITRT